MHFSATEQIDLLKAWLVLTLVFVIRDNRMGVGLTDPQRWGTYLFVVGAGIILHEIAHKAMANRFGFWAEFKSDDRMLIIAVVLVYLTGWFFAAPGAVWWTGAASRKEAGLISLAGPLTNIIIAYSCLAAFYLLYPTGPNGILNLLALSTSINAWIGFFNLLPIEPLDGSKILKSLPVLWIASILLCAYLLFIH